MLCQGYDLTEHQARAVLHKRREGGRELLLAGGAQ